MMNAAAAVAMIDDEDDSNSDISISESDEYEPSTSDYSSEDTDESDSDDDSNDQQPSSSSTQWICPADGTTFKQFPNPPIKSSHLAPLQNKTPFEYFSLFVSEDIFELIMKETNRNAHQFLSSHRVSRKSRFSKWKDTNKDEIKQFLGLVMFMGLVKYPSISYYWSKKPIYTSDFCSKVMSRNRFQLLLRFFHFADNESLQDSEDPKLHKVKMLVQMLVQNFKTFQDPGEDIVIDETMIPYRGRLSFKQYIPGKAHKYGVKLFKLTDPSGYTYNVEIYQGKSNNLAFDGVSKSAGICLRLAADYFDKGRTLTVDNFYTSVEPAKKCLGKRTHLQRTLRNGRKGLPPLKENLKKGECISKEKDGVVVGMWKDKRPVTFLSTCDVGKLVSTSKKNRNGQDIVKPDIILKYNRCKQGIDLSDQLASYFSPLRKTIRWFHKVAFELLLNTAVVNAYLLYNEEAVRRMQVAEFRENIIMSLTQKRRDDQGEEPSEGTKHMLIETDERTSDNRKKRGRCTACYSAIAAKEGPSIARKKAKLVSTRCSQCANKAYFCLEHFQTHHPN